MSKRTSLPQFYFKYFKSCLLLHDSIVRCLGKHILKEPAFMKVQNHHLVNAGLPQQESSAWRPELEVTNENHSPTGKWYFRKRNAPRTESAD